jgi:hypothetical protein
VSSRRSRPNGPDGPLPWGTARQLSRIGRVHGGNCLPNALCDNINRRSSVFLGNRAIRYRWRKKSKYVVVQQVWPFRPGGLAISSAANRAATPTSLRLNSDGGEAIPGASGANVTNIRWASSQFLGEMAHEKWAVCMPPLCRVHSCDLHFYGVSALVIGSLSGCDTLFGGYVFPEKALYLLLTAPALEQMHRSIANLRVSAVAIGEDLVASPQP